MIEKALIIALVAVGVVVAATSIASALDKLSDRAKCGFTQAKVCVIDANGKDGK